MQCSLCRPHPPARATLTEIGFGRRLVFSLTLAYCPNDYATEWAPTPPRPSPVCPRMVNDVVSDLTSGLGEFCLRFFSGWLGGFLVGGRCPEAASVRALGCGRTLYLASNSPTPCLTPVGLLLLLLLVRRLCAVAAFVCLFVCLALRSRAPASAWVLYLPQPLSLLLLPLPPSAPCLCCLSSRLNAYWRLLIFTFLFVFPACCCCCCCFFLVEFFGCRWLSAQQCCDSEKKK